MSKLSLTDPGHWHDPDGSHRMKDPRDLPGYAPQYWDRDERLYVAHLAAHEDAVASPVPMIGDSHEIRQLFALLRTREKEVKLIKQLIAALRQSETTKE